MQGMSYRGQTNAVAVTTALDVFELVCPADCIIAIERIGIGQDTEEADAQAEMLPVFFKKGVGNTSGSGGTTPSKVAAQTGFAASGATLEANNTTQASAGGGSLTTFHSDAFNVQIGFQWVEVPGVDEIILSPSESLIVAIAAPADSTTINTVLKWREIGG